MNTLLAFKADLVSAAARLGNINDFNLWPRDETKLANGYRQAVAEGKERLKNSYIAALLLRHWKDISKLYQKCKTCDRKNTIYDFTTIIYERIEYALKYHRWTDKPNLNAQQCINQAIATEVQNQMYFSNLHKNKANAVANSISLDDTIAVDAGDRQTALVDTIADFNDKTASAKVNDLIQYLIDNNKIIEAITVDGIANSQTAKITSEIKLKDKIVEDENGKPVYTTEGTIKTEQVKQKEYFIEICRRKKAEFLMNLPLDYATNFQKRFKINESILLQVINEIATAKSSKIYKYVDGTTAYLQKNKELFRELLQ